MRLSRALVFFPMSLLLGTAVAQDTPPPKPQPPPGAELGMKPEPPPEIWQIDLVPTGSGFTVTKPVLEGDTWVFKVWPDRNVVRLPKSKVKNMVRRTKDVDNEVVYRIDLVPTGQMYARDEPVSKGGTYQFHRWMGGALMSVRPGDVKKITKLKGMDAFRVHMEQLAAKPIGDLPMQGERSAPAASGQPGNEPGSMASAQGQPPGNWIYQGVPGVTDAWAPPSATVAYPGDVPKAPEPH
jgi:hypothetical protein